MKVVFRADASLLIGSGHIMRCLTLADALRANGAECRFICRDHSGHLNELVRRRGYTVHVLAREPVGVSGLPAAANLAHAAWLGVSQEQDAHEVAPVLHELQPDWLVVDHYALDYRWERVASRDCRKLLVIDDLADRTHICDLLLDQNLGRAPSDYAKLLPAGCKILIGPAFALLRPEFAALRDYSLKRRQQPQLESILISMGGVDQSNVTAKVLESLKRCALPQSCSIAVVMGTKAPWVEEIRTLAAQMPWSTNVLVGIDDMAMRLANSDLAIGAAGSTSWERCCLGVPTLMAILADNQRVIGQALERAGAARLVGYDDLIEASFSARVTELLGNPDLLGQMSRDGANITDGRGVLSVLSWMMEK